MKPRHPAPLPLTPAIWQRLTQPTAPRVRGLILAGTPHIIISTPPRRDA